MNVLILNWKDIRNPAAGGAEVVAFEFARRLVWQGHRVVFFCRRYNKCFDEETIDGITIIRRGNKLSVYIYAYLYYRSLKKKPDKVVDMINTICWQTPLYVPTERRVAYVNQLAKEVLFFEVQWPLSVFAYLLERFEYITYKTTKFVCFSQSTIGDLVTFGIARDQIGVFPLGVDHYRYKKGLNKTKNPFFIFVARLVKMKRADLCIRAFYEVYKEYPKAKLAIVGNGPEKKKLENLIAQYRLDQAVEFVNKKDFFIDKNTHDLKVAMMQKAWCLLLPSVKEGWGMVVTEAAACGTPSIVTKVTGLVDSVIPNKTGIIISSNPTPNELSSAMIRIIKNKKLRDDLSKNALEFVKTLSWDKSFKEFYKLIN